MAQDKVIGPQCGSPTDRYGLRGLVVGKPQSWNRNVPLRLGAQGKDGPFNLRAN